MLAGDSGYRINMVEGENMSVRRICPKCKKVQSDTERVGRDICYHCRVFKGEKQTLYSGAEIRAKLRGYHTAKAETKWRPLLELLEEKSNV